MKKAIFVLCILLLALPVVHGLTAAIGNGKAVIRVNATPEDPAILERTLQIPNKNDIPVIVTLTPTDDIVKFIDIPQPEFVIQPGETKLAEYTLTIDRGGKFEGGINVAFTPEDPDSKENGVGLSASIIILSEGPIIEELEEPEQPEDTGENITGDETEGTDNSSVSVNLGGGKKTPVEPTTTKGSSSNKPSPVVGVLIIAVILVVGLAAVFFMINMSKKR